MTEQEKETIRKWLDGVREHVDKDAVTWLAMTIMLKGGARFTLHTKDAPNRPRGIS